VYENTFTDKIKYDLQDSPKDCKGARVWSKDLPSERHEKKQHRSSLGKIEKYRELRK